MKKIFITILVLSLCIAGYFEGESSFAAPRIGNPVIDNDIITLGFKDMNMGSLTPEDVLISEHGANAILKLIQQKVVIPQVMKKKILKAIMEIIKRNDVLLMYMKKNKNIFSGYGASFHGRAYVTGIITINGRKKRCNIQLDKQGNAVN